MLTYQNVGQVFFEFINLLVKNFYFVLTKYFKSEASQLALIISFNLIKFL